MTSRHSTSSTPPLTPASTHGPPPPSGDSSGRQPLAREDSEMRRLNLKTILSEALKCAQTLKTGEVTDTELERIAVEFLKGLYAHSPKDLQPKLIAELKAKVLPLLLETNTMPMNMTDANENDFPKTNGISIEELMGWTVQKILLPVGLGFLIFLITLYVTKA